MSAFMQKYITILGVRVNKEGNKTPLSSWLDPYHLTSINNNSLLAEFYD